jgi:hypothetical protein
MNDTVLEKPETTTATKKTHVGEAKPTYDGKITGLDPIFDVEKNQTTYIVEYRGHMNNSEQLLQCESSIEQYVKKYGEDNALQFAKWYDDNIDWLRPYL